VVVVSGTLCVVVVSAESLHAATVNSANAETDARTSFFMTYLLNARPHPTRRRLGNADTHYGLRHIV
jgi:hypothetical protein